MNFQNGGLEANNSNSIVRNMLLKMFLHNDQTAQR